jgi:hypothetical protein
MFANVSEEYTSSIFRVEKKQAAKRTHLDQNTWLRCRLGNIPERTSGHEKQSRVTSDGPENCRICRREAMGPDYTALRPIK